jgi:hypothetical protein
MHCETVWVVSALRQQISCNIDNEVVKAESMDVIIHAKRGLWNSDVCSRRQAVQGRYSSDCVELEELPESESSLFSSSSFSIRAGQQSLQSGTFSTPSNSLM